MIEIKSEREINLMRNAGKIMKEIQKEVKRFIKPGISTWELNKLIKNIIEKNGARSAEYNYPNFHKGKPAFPGHACISVNEQIIHRSSIEKSCIKRPEIL